MWLKISIIVLFLVCLYLLYTFLMKAVDEDDTKTEDEKIKLSHEKPTAEKRKAKMVSVYNDVKDQDGDTIVFNNMYRINKKELGDFIQNHLFDGYIPDFLFTHIDNYRLEKSQGWYWSKFVDTNETYKRDSWYKIDNGEYYTNDGVIYRFKDWLEVDSFEDWFINNRDNLKGRIELCKDPREEHWEHFLELEIKAKKEMLQQCKEWVDTVLKKQQKYNDICLINEVATTPLIHDYETLKNFCNMSGEKVKFEEYEITNYLLIIRNTLTKV